MTTPASNDPPPRERPWTYRCGDGVAGLLAHGPVDHTFYDPPYDEDVDAGNAAIENRDNPFGFAPMTEALRNRTARAVATQTRRWSLGFCSIEEAHLWRFAMIAAGMSYWRTGIWRRLNTIPQLNGLGPAQSFEAIVICHSRVLPQQWYGGGKPAEWSHPIVRGSERMHPTQKPSSLMRELVEDFTETGELIADPFAGVATTGVAALGLGRRFVGWELNKDHYANGMARLETPLLDRPSCTQEQLNIESSGRKSKGAAARARRMLDSKMLSVLEAAGSEGVSASQLPDLVGTEESDVRRSLQRLKKADVVHRHGRTKNARWFAKQYIQETP